MKSILKNQYHYASFVLLSTVGIPLRCNPSSYSLNNSNASLGTIYSNPLMNAYAYFCILSIILAAQNYLTYYFLFSCVTGMFSPFGINSMIYYLPRIVST